MIIDPDRDGCTIWHGNKVQHLKGTIPECCEKIINHVTRVFESSYVGFERKQVYFDIRLDVHGLGRAYAECFKDNGIEFEVVKVGEIIK